MASDYTNAFTFVGKVIHGFYPEILQLFYNLRIVNKFAQYANFPVGIFFFQFFCSLNRSFYAVTKTGMACEFNIFGYLKHVLFNKVALKKLVRWYYLIMDMFLVQ